MGVEVGEECTRIKDLGVISISVIATFMKGMKMPLEIMGQLDEDLQNFKARQQKRIQKNQKSNVRKLEEEVISFKIQRKIN